MPGAVVPVAQSLFVLALPMLLALAPSQGAVRTVRLTNASTAAIVNAVVEVDGRIVSARRDGSLVLAGRRDRIAQALLPLGVIPLPTQADGCSYVRKAR
ncbi:MAG TPA: hypothetical protein VF475_09400 [Sphingobium sp.]